MNGRIYPQDVFEKALREIEKGEKYCPNCLSNNIDYKERDINIVYIYEYKCYSCFKIFHKDSSLNKSQVREKKIDRILEK